MRDHLQMAADKVVDVFGHFHVKENNYVFNIIVGSKAPLIMNKQHSLHQT